MAACLRQGHAGRRPGIRWIPSARNSGHARCGASRLRAIRAGRRRVSAGASDDGEKWGGPFRCSCTCPSLCTARQSYPRCAAAEPSRRRNALVAAAPIGRCTAPLRASACREALLPAESECSEHLSAWPSPSLACPSLGCPPPRPAPSVSQPRLRGHENACARVDAALCARSACSTGSADPRLCVSLCLPSLALTRTVAS